MEGGERKARLVSDSQLAIWLTRKQEQMYTYIQGRMLLFIPLRWFLVSV
jgi:hypothetical protein